MAFDSFEERLAALEERVISLKDLPLATLQRKLEQDWHPEAGVLLGENSITPAMLASALYFGGVRLQMRFGTTAMSTGGAVVNTSAVVTHNAGFTPTRVFACAESNGVISANAHTYTATQFTLGQYYVDGVARVVANNIHWLAIAFG